MTEKQTKEMEKKSYISRLCIYLGINGFSQTSERRAIAEAIADFDKHFTIHDLQSYLQNNKYHISLATLYNNINLMINAGLVNKYQFSTNSQPYYEKCLDNQRHNHIYNIKSKELIEFSDPKISEIITDIEQKYNFKVLQHSFIIYVENNN